MLLHTFNLIKEGGMEDGTLVSSSGDDHKQPLRGKKKKPHFTICVEAAYTVAVARGSKRMSTLPNVYKYFTATGRKLLFFFFFNCTGIKRAFIYLFLRKRTWLIAFCRAKCKKFE